MPQPNKQSLAHAGYRAAAAEISELCEQVDWYAFALDTLDLDEQAREGFEMLLAESVRALAAEATKLSAKQIIDELPEAHA